MPSDCPYCGKPHFNFGDDEEGVEMWINEPNDGEYVIVADPPFAWSTPINFCPFCGRKLEKVSTMLFGHYDALCGLDSCGTDTWQRLADLIDRPSENIERPR